MHFAYLISAHTDAPQLKRLIEALHPDAEFFVHIDLKSRLEDFTSLIHQDNVHFVEKRTDVVWGSIRQVEYQMTLIQSALTFPVKFDRFFFLSGLDYPLWNCNQITSWMQKHPNEEFISGYQMDTELLPKDQVELYEVARPFVHLCFLSQKWNQRLSILARKTKRLLGLRKKRHFTVNGETWHLYKGADWWCVSRNLLLSIYNVYTTQPEVREYFKDSFAPSETLPQTIAFNSKEWSSHCILHKGKYPGLTTLTPLHRIIYDPIIKVMDESDYDMLMESGKMFARKFLSGKSEALIKKIIENHHGNN